MVEVKNPARARLAGGEVSIGVGLRLARGVEIARIMRSCGWDWLFIDLEHGAMSLDTCSQISVAALDAGIAPIVRVPQGQLDMATRALDGGGWGIVMPHVDTAEEAAAFVERVKYPPQGHRSVMGALPHFGYRGLGVGEAAKIVNAEMLVTVMIETPRALENAEKIAAVPGVDVVFAASTNLGSFSGLKQGENDYEAMVRSIHDATLEAGRKLGGPLAWRGRPGFTFFQAPTESTYIRLGVQRTLEQAPTGVAPIEGVER